MQSSKIIEVDGIFVGAAVLLPDAAGWRFVAAHARAASADGVTAATLQEAEVVARRAWLGFRQAGQAERIC